MISSALNSTSTNRLGRDRSGIGRASRWLGIAALGIALGCQQKPRVEEASQPIRSTVTDATFEQQVLKSDKLVMVDFAADWCGPCHMMEPVLRELKTKFGDRAAIETVDVDESPDLAREYNIRALPTFVFIRDGKELSRVEGAYDYDHMEKILESHLSANEPPAS